MIPDLTPAIERASRDELPALLGALVVAEAKVRLRLAEVPAPAPTPTSRLLDVEQAAAMAGCSPRWLRAATRGHRCRRDLSRKAPRWDEELLRRWLAERRG